MSASNAALFENL